MIYQGLAAPRVSETWRSLNPYGPFDWMLVCSQGRANHAKLNVSRDKEVNCA